MELDKTVSRIRKLLALANDKGATEAEASLAMEKAQAMMAEANLSFATIEASGQSAGQDAERTKDAFAKRTVYNWHKALMQEIAKLNSVYCELLYTKLVHTRRFDGYNMIGRAANIASTRVMYEYLTETIERLGREYVGGDPTQFFTQSAHLFKDGCAHRIVERLTERHEAALKAQEKAAAEQKARANHPAYAGTGTAVVMRDYYSSEVDLNDDMRRGWAPGTTAQNRRESEERSANARRQYKMRLDAFVAQGYSDDMAFYLAHGYSVETATEFTRPSKPAKDKPETDAQRRKRQAREERNNDRYWDQEARRRAAANHPDRLAGRAAGENVSLDQQIDREKRKGIA